MKRGVIFDMDGVLVASGPAHAASWRALARKHGIEISDEQFKKSFGQTSRDIIRSLFGSKLPDEQVAAYDAEKEAVYRDLIQGMVPLTIGAREMLQGLHENGCVLALATSGPRENVELVLNETGLGALFQAVVTGFDVQRGKPAPDCFLLAAERADLLPENCVVVEDAPAGVEAGRAAGMKTVGLVGTHPAMRLVAAGATLVVERLAEITPDTIANLLAGN